MCVVGVWIGPLWLVSCTSTRQCNIYMRGGVIKQLFCLGHVTRYVRMYTMRIRGRGRWRGEIPVDGVASKEEGQPSSLFWLLPLWDRGGLNVNRINADLASCRRCRVGGQSGLVGAVAGRHGLHDATGDDGAGVMCASERGWWVLERGALEAGGCVCVCLCGGGHA